MVHHRVTIVNHGAYLDVAWYTLVYHMSTMVNVHAYHGRQYGII